MRFILTILLWLFASPVWAAITFDTFAFDQCVDPCNQILTGNTNTIHAWAVTAVSIKTATTDSNTVTSFADDKGSTWTLTAVVHPATNGDKLRVEIWTCQDVKGASATITIDFSGSGLVTSATGFYLGPLALGTNTSNTGTGTTATVDLTTQDANNFAVAACGAIKIGTITGSFSSSVGNLRAELANDDGADLIQAGINDNTAASPGTVTNTVTIDTSANWVCGVVELRTVATSSRKPSSAIVFQ